MKSAGKARNNGLYRHIRTSKEIIRNLLNDYNNNSNRIILEDTYSKFKILLFVPCCFSLKSWKAKLSVLQKRD